MGAGGVTQRDLFMVWWKGDEERAKCFLEQAVMAYLSTFPARCQLLLVELLEPPSTTDHDLSVPGIAERGDPTGGPVEGGVYSKVLDKIAEALEDISSAMYSIERKHGDN